MNRLTASRLELATSCPAAFTLPWRDDRTVDSDAGRANHATYEQYILEGNTPEALVVAFPNVKQWFAETKLAYNVATGTGRILGHGTDRNYVGADALEMAGTCDVYGVDGDRIIVVDWKLRRFTKAAENLQLRWYALALARALGKDAATVAIFPEVGAPSLADLDVFHFEAFAERLKAIVLAVSAKSDAYNVGEQCRYCPAFLACPKQRRELALVASGAVDTHVEMLLPLDTDEGAAMVYELWQKVQIISKRLGAAIHARAAADPIPLGNGMVFGPRPVQGNRKIDGDKAYEAIRMKHGQAVADAAVSREATQKGIEDAFKAAGIASPKAEKDKLMKALEQAGAVTRKDSTTIDEHPALKAMGE